jgi:TnpA family transposase
MAGKWLSRADRDRLSGWPKIIMEPDLFAFFTLSEFDQKLLSARRRDGNRLGFALALCALRFLGFFPDETARVPDEALSFLSSQIGVSPDSRDTYGKRARTRTDHQIEAMAALGFRRQTGPDRHALVEWLTRRALEHDRPMALLRMAAERLRSQKILRPGLDFLERDVASARFAATEILWRHTERLLKPDLRRTLDDLLIPGTTKTLTRFQSLKQSPSAADPEAINETLDKIDWYQKVGVNRWNVGFFTPNLLRYLAAVAKRGDAQALRRLRPNRRYPILVAFLAERHGETLDALIDQYDRCLADIQSKSLREFEQLRVEAALSSDDRRRLLAQVGRILLDDTVPPDRVRESVFGIVPQNILKRAVSECDIEERPENDWPADRIARRFGRLRQFSMRLLSTVEWKGVKETESLLKAVRLIEKIWGKGGRRLPEIVPTGFVPTKWRRFVFPEPKRIDPKFYELCILWELRLALRAGTVWAEGARRYTDPSGFLIRRADWPKFKPEILSGTGNPSVATLKFSAFEADLKTALAILDRELKSGIHVRLDENGELSLSRLDAEDRPPELEAFRAALTDRLPRVELSELLIDIDHRLRFSDKLIHVSNHKRTPVASLSALYAAILGMGGNFGFARMAQMTGLSERKIAYRTSKNLRGDTLTAANAELVNFCHHHPLTKTWGDGTLSSSDGQRFETRGKSLASSANPKYFGFGRGLSAYTWISDQYMLYGTKIIPTNLREATFILDGILDNQSDLPIREHTADTHGYTELTFGLFALLGLQFSPRIKDLGSQRLYRLGKLPATPAVTLLEGKINTQLIERHWDELLRLAGSLKLGFVPASSVLTRLHNAPRKNPLVRALQEYGRLAKTLFIVRYLGSKEFRRRINTQLNRGEAEHALWAFIFTGREGKFHKHTLDDLNDQGICVSLIANAVQVWNTLYYEEILNRSKADGQPLDQSLLKYVSPHIHEHINPYGKVTFPLEEITRRKGLRPLHDPKKEQLEIEEDEED